MKAGLIGVLAMAGALVGVVAISPQGAAAQNQRQAGLVNVAVGDVTIAENVALGAAIGVAANVCGVAVGNVAILAALVGQNQQTATICQIDQDGQMVPVTITSAQGNGGGGGGQGPNQNQAGLVNVAIGDVTVLRNVAIGIAAQVAANICGVTVGNVAALASGVFQNQEAETVCTIGQGDQAVPVQITPAG